MSHVLRRQGASRVPDCSSNYGYPCSHVLPSATDTQPNWGQQQVHVQPPVKPVVEAMRVSLWFQFRACWPVIGMAALFVCKGPPRSPSRATPATRSHTENPRWARASKSRPESQPRIQTTKFEKSFNKPAPQQAVLVGRSEWVLEDRVGRGHPLSMSPGTTDTKSELPFHPFLLPTFALKTWHVEAWGDWGYAGRWPQKSYGHAMYATTLCLWHTVYSYKRIRGCWIWVAPKAFAWRAFAWTSDQPQETESTSAGSLIYVRVLHIQHARGRDTVCFASDQSSLAWCVFVVGSEDRSSDPRSDGPFACCKSAEVRRLVRCLLLAKPR